MKRSARAAAVVARLALQDGTSSASTRISEDVKESKGAKGKRSASSSIDTVKAIKLSKAKSLSGDVESSKSKGAGAVPKINQVDGKKKKSVSKKPKIEPTVQANETSPYFPVTQNPGLTSAIKLTREFYNQDCVPLCKALLGTVLARRLPGTGKIVRGTIVETEAYAGYDDKASVSYQGRRTPGNEAMFLDPGTAYVYMTYGMYFCFNVSTKGEGSACLLRAVEPLEDYEIMHNLRKPKRKKKDVVEDSSSKAPAEPDVSKRPQKRLKSYELANGPSKLCMAFDIRKETCDKIDMANSDELWIEFSQEAKFRDREFEIEITKRIGIDSAPPEYRDRLLRFLIRDNFSVSKAKVSEIKKRLEIESS